MHENYKLQRVIQESVPGKQVTLAHVLASPEKQVSQRIGVKEGVSIGILTISPSETAIIAADIASKSSSIEIGFLDRFTGSVVILGDLQSVEVALESVVDTLENALGFTGTEITRS